MRMLALKDLELEVTTNVESPRCRGVGRIRRVPMLQDEYCGQLNFDKNLNIENCFPNTLWSER